jgi:hypothetical protein
MNKFTLLALFHLVIYFSPVHAVDPPLALSKEDQKVEALNQRVKLLEQQKQPKMLRPNQDIDFLFSAVFGEGYINEDTSIKFKGLDLVKIEENLFFSGATAYLKKQNCTVTNNENCLEEVPAGNKLKLGVIEKELGITNKGTLRERISLVHLEVNNDSWENDNLRFGILTNKLQDSRIIATSIALHSYFGYHRFLPGKWNRENLARRTSMYFSVGKAGQSLPGVEVDGEIYGVGFGLDIVKGVSLSLGYNILQVKDIGYSDFNSHEEWSFGVTLNSDLWKGFLTGN